MSQKVKSSLLKETGVARRSKTKKDAALIARALRQRWPIPAAVRPEIVKRLVAVARKKGPDSDPNAMRAAQVLVQMDAQNQVDDQLREKNVRLDLGKATERVSIEQIIVEKPVRRA